MSALALRPQALAPRLLAHFAAQQESADRLLELVLEQGQAIRAREVDSVLARMAQIQYEMERRGELEHERAVLLTEAGAGLGLAAHAVTLSALLPALDPAAAATAHTMSARLRGTLSEIGAQHQRNRALMRQELAFLSHLTRLLTVSPGDEAGYSSSFTGAPAVAPRLPRGLAALDMTA